MFLSFSLGFSFSEEFSDEDEPSLEPPLELPSVELFEGFPDEFDGEIVGLSPPRMARLPHSLVVR